MPGVNLCRAVPLVAYAPASQARLAAEIDAAPAAAAWPDWIRDYGRLRDALRACQAVR